jgi:putative transposase
MLYAIIEACVRHSRTAASRPLPSSTALSNSLRHVAGCTTHLLAERRDACDQRQESVRLYDQHATLPARNTERPSLAGGQAQVVQHVAVRSDLAFKAFFRRCNAGEAPGSPRFRGKGRSDSITFPQVPVGCNLGAGSALLYVLNVGRIKLVYHRPLAGTPKTATIRRSSPGTWYVSFSCACAEPSPWPNTGQQVGRDVGLKTFATFSTGAALANPRCFRQEAQALASAPRRLAHVEQGTPHRAARRKVLARVYERSAWRRGDFAHQHSRRIVNACDRIAVEDLSVNRMVRTHCLAKSIHAAAWSQFADLLAYKAAWAGRTFVAVNPASTSQDCSQCGHRQVRSLSRIASTPAPVVAWS